MAPGKRVFFIVMLFLIGIAGNALINHFEAKAKEEVALKQPTQEAEKGDVTAPAIEAPATSPAVK